MLAAVEVESGSISKKGEASPDPRTAGGMKPPAPEPASVAANQTGPDDANEDTVEDMDPASEKPAARGRHRHHDWISRGISATWAGLREAALGANLRPLPIRDSLQGYTPRKLKADLRAGLNTALVALPQGLAYASIAGLPIRYGVYASAVAALVGPFLSSSRHAIQGPTNASAIMLASVFGGLTLSMVAAMPLLLFMVAAILIAGSFFKLANLIQYMSRSVIVGYITAAAVLIIANQFHHTLGIAMDAGPAFFDLAKASIVQIPQLNAATATVSLVSLVTYLFIQRTFPVLPAAALTLIIATGFTYLAHQQELLENPMFHGFGEIEFFHSFPIGLSSWPMQFPRLSWDFINQLLGAAMGMAFICALENSVITRTIANKSGDRLNMNQELLSLGASNAAASILTGMPISGSPTRSALNFASGAETQISAIFSGVICALAAFGIGAVTGYVPKACVSVLVIVSAISLFDPRKLRMALQSTRSDAVVTIITGVSALLAPLNVAIFLGVGVSIVLYLRKAARPQMVEYEFNAEGNLSEKEAAKARHIAEISIVHVEGELFFGAAELFRDQIQRIAAEPNLRIVILRLRNARHLDATAMMALEELLQFMHDKHRYLLISGIQKDAYKVLRNSGLVESIGRENIFPGSATNPNIATRNALKRAQTLLGGEKAEIRIFVDANKQAAAAPA